MNQPFDYLLTKLHKQTALAPFLLFSDLDGAYLYKDNHVYDTLKKEDEEKYKSTLELHAFLKKMNIPLIIVSGRDFSQIQSLKKDFTHLFPHLASLFEFDAFIGAVGTEIWSKNDNDEYVFCEEYATYITKTYSFDSEDLHPICLDLIDEVRSNFPQSQFRFQLLHRQKFKISFEFESAPSESTQIRSLIDDFLFKKLHTKYRLILSHQRFGGKDTTYNLDLLPCGKETALEYVCNSLAATQSVSCFTAGDAGNDISMLFDTDSIGIVVSNPKPELEEYVSNLPSTSLQGNFFLTANKTFYKGPNHMSSAQSIQHAISEYFTKQGII